MRAQPHIRPSRPGNGARRSFGSTGTGRTLRGPLPGGPAWADEVYALIPEENTQTPASLAVRPVTERTLRFVFRCRSFLAETS